MENLNISSGKELADLIRNRLDGIVPRSAMEFYGSDNFETGDVYFHMRIRVPSMETLRVTQGTTAERTADHEL